MYYILYVYTICIIWHGCLIRNFSFLAKIFPLRALQLLLSCIVISLIRMLVSKNIYHARIGKKLQRAVVPP